MKPELTLLTPEGTEQAGENETPTLALASRFWLFNDLVDQSSVGGRCVDVASQVCEKDQSWDEYWIPAGRVTHPGVTAAQKPEDQGWVPAGAEGPPSLYSQASS